MFGQLDIAMSINSDDSKFDYLYYLDLIEQNRAVDLRNEYNKLRSIHSSVVQKLCLEIEIVDSYICCDGLFTGCTLMKTKVKVPDTIELHQKDGIINVMPPDIKAASFIYTTMDRAKDVGNTLISANLIYAFTYDGYIWITSKKPNYKLIDKIIIQAVFTNPYKAGQLDCNHCMTYDDNYPLTEWMWQSLTKGKVLQELIGSQYMPQDEVNNAKDDKTDLNINNKNKQQ